MKKHISLILGIALWNISNSQTITTSNMLTVGDSIKCTYIKAQGLSPGGSGQNQTWSFANSTDSMSLMFYAVNPNTTSYAASFPQSNLAIGDANGNYDFFNSSPTEFVFNGQGNVFVTIPYQLPLIQFKFPMNYGDSYTSAISGTFSYSGLTYFRKGTQTVEVDGTGTLITPKGTFQNVLRAKTEQLISDSANYMGTPYVYPSSTVTYSFLHPAFKHYIFDISYIFPFGSPASAHYRYYDQDVTLGFVEFSEANHYSVYPNPATDFLVVETKNSGGSHQLELLDMMGRLVKCQTFSSQKAEVNLNGLSPGVYLLRINDKVLQKVVKG